jgi:hypothetical protein
MNSKVDLQENFDLREIHRWIEINSLVLSIKCHKTTNLLAIFSSSYEDPNSKMMDKVPKNFNWSY